MNAATDTELTFACPECGQELQADESMRGSEISCPACNKEIVVPLPDLGDEVESNIIVTTTGSIDGRRVKKYLRLVMGDAVLGVNLFSDALGEITDVIGGRSRTWEKHFMQARYDAIADLLREARGIKADAVLGVKIDHELLGPRQEMLLVTVSGTAVQLAGS